MKIKMFLKMDGLIELNGKNGRDKSKKRCSFLGIRNKEKGI
ncbi:hypothetical protein [Xylanivirga thermophila]|jgi:hypothetical protein|nr:hypothetical protein [Xylanivirga thermophila]